MRATIDEWRDDAQTEPLASGNARGLDAELDRIDFSAPTLVHDDFWSGNTVAYRGRIIGIIDWTSAEVGDPRTDVSECRIDMVLSHGIEVADAFRDDYERLAGPGWRTCGTSTCFAASTRSWSTSTGWRGTTTWGLST